MDVQRSNGTEQYTLNIRRARVLKLVNHFRWQVQHGCKDVRCVAPTCYTTRLRESRKNGQGPLRKYTELSALAVAFSLVSSPNAQSMLCPLVTEKQISMLGIPEKAQVDQKSLMQRLCSTSAVNYFLGGDREQDPGQPDTVEAGDPPACVQNESSTIEWKDLQEMNIFLTNRWTYKCGRFHTLANQRIAKVHEYIIKLFESPQRLEGSFRGILPDLPVRMTEGNANAMSLTLESLSKRHRIPLHECLRRCLRRIQRDSMDVDLRRIIVICFLTLGLLNQDRMIQQSINDVPEDKRMPEFITSWGVATGPSFDLVGAICEVLSQRLRRGAGDELMASLMGSLYLTGGVITISAMAVRVGLWVHFLQTTLLKEWDKSPLIRISSSTGHILEVLETILMKDWSDAGVFNKDEPDYSAWPEHAFHLHMLGGHYIGGLWQYFNTETACYLWLEGNLDKDVRHVFTYQFLYQKEDYWQFFRTCCHIHMRQAVKGASFVHYARQRIFPALTQQHDEYLDRRLKVVEESYLVLKISRDDIVTDAISQLWQREGRTLRKPLRVRLGSDEGEIGHDLGGVQIEFFNLLCRELFEGGRPIFTTDESTQLSWFAVGSLEPLYRYELIGVLFGLAIYNGITLPISFPLAFYKKLIGCTTSRNDLAELWPGVLKSLLEVEKYEGDVESDLALEQTYNIRVNGVDMSIDATQYGADYYNPEIPHERKGRVRVLWAKSDANSQKKRKDKSPASGGGVEESQCSEEEEVDVENLSWPGWEFTKTPVGETAVPVTNENRSAHIEQYTRWILDYSIRPQFYAFASGFYEVIDPRIGRLMPAAYLRQLVEGSAQIDAADLKRLITYEGYTADSEQIVWFWTIIEEYEQEKLRSLLEFVTGSRRMPASGQQSLRFNISKIEGDTVSLPGASTCFGNLLLPEYESKEVMETKMGIALEHSLGFGQA
ncbi:hypothetical protein BDZ85DRAFT_262185 [Elsinoe ampelina]|uniref:HECT-type E3 ubiquitin transferase n=1 Tax=Elsinoe ampelina TaxID=302913 RepID=A0A6A6GDI3_9PEZI|nr:hypothetical protein BDZ85DRAFT_262185 [Elsinoe ampelina]